MKQMECNQIQNNFSDYLMQELDQKSSAILSDHLKTCESCKLEFEQLTSIWTKLEVLPESQPGPNLRTNFYSMLTEEINKEQQQTESVFKRILNFFPSFPEASPKFAYSILSIVLLICVGFMAGYFTFSGKTSQYINQISNLKESKDSSQQKLVLAYLDQQSPIQRLKGVSESTEIKNPDNTLLNALINTLTNDTNINVRLSAVDALYLFADNTLVKDGLIKSLPLQESPLVQVALIDLLTEIREAKATQALKTLLQKNKLNPEVKKRAEAIVGRTI